MTFRIVFDHSPEREEHAAKLVKHHINENDKKVPRIAGIGLAKDIVVCETCDNVFVKNINSYRYECYECAPSKKEKEAKGFGF